ncbi:Gamma-glutamyltranspeptidase 1 [Thelohanellus kitauei]|uniref:Gamma-glutamyltranspeptidase 1 n=1 Tax=Thelohanellus kitauei TaxID=669202 RepID=A0A0C2MJ66_THEKT|nr:Gamma-glutamyltranspeptidase 1 [Thelohanellus kitauei]
MLCLVTFIFFVLFGNYDSLNVPGFTEPVYKNAAITSENKVCSDIGVQVLKEKGSSVDAAIAAMFCLGVTNMQSSGIGGGGVLVVYDSKMNNNDRNTVVYDFRETSPRKLPEFAKEHRPSDSRWDGMSIAVPGEIYGLYTAWKEYGKLDWERLIKPSIDLAQSGFGLGQKLWEAANEHASVLKNDEALRSLLFVGEELKSPGSLIVNTKLAETLQIDLENYNVIKRNTIDLDLTGGYKIKSAPLPFGGLVIEAILNILKGFNINPSVLKSDETKANTYHNIVEAFKLGFGLRTRFGDPDFMKAQYLQDLVTFIDPIQGEVLRSKITNQTHEEAYYEPINQLRIDQGTSHLSIVGPDGLAVAVTSSINGHFGSKYLSPTTGILYNNHIKDFNGMEYTEFTQNNELKPDTLSGASSDSTQMDSDLHKPDIVSDAEGPGLRFNTVEARKRPLSSMSPTLVFKNDELYIVIGGAGGPKIITSIVIIHTIWLGLPFDEAIRSPRLHHMLHPNTLFVEKDQKIQGRVIDLLSSVYGHEIMPLPEDEISSIQAIMIQKKSLQGVSDPRSYGGVSGY